MKFNLYITTSTLPSLLRSVGLQPKETSHTFTVPFVFFILYGEALSSVHWPTNHITQACQSCHVVLYVHGFRKRDVGIVQDIRHSLEMVSRANVDEWGRMGIEWSACQGHFKCCEHSAFFIGVEETGISQFLGITPAFYLSQIRSDQIPSERQLKLTLDAAYRRSYPRICPCLDRGIFGLGSINAANNELWMHTEYPPSNSIEGPKFRPVTQFRLKARSYSVPT